jgi:transposase
MDMELNEQLEKLIEVVQSLESRITEFETENRQLRDKNKRLQEKVDYLTDKLYGKSSEKTSSLTIGQMSFFDEAEMEMNPNAPELDLEEVEQYRKKKFKGQRAKLLKDLPHEKRLCTLVDEDRFCDKCGHDLVSVGEEFIRTEIELIPAKVRVIDVYRETFECRACRKKGKPHFEKSPMPYPVIQHSMATASTVAWVMHQKFVNAMPLYRQEKEWQRLGVHLSRSTMANWMIVAAREWLYPLVDLMHKKLLESSHLHADETTVQVMKEPGRKNTSKSYMWVYGTAKHSEHPVRIFEYQPGRGGEYPKAFLKGFKGYLHTDAYAGYNQTEVTRCYCWAHSRRKFIDALPKNTKNAKEELAFPGIAFCNELFKIEKQLENVDNEKRRNERLKQEGPVLEAFWLWAESLKASNHVLPKGKLATALNYAINHKEGFMNYLLDGGCSLSNNLAENSIRPFTIGRKNWLFSGSPRGAKASAAIYSIIETAKANGLEPYKYLLYIFKELPGVQFGRHPEFLEEYLPWDEEVQRICK